MTLKIKTLMVGAAALALSACGEGPIGKFWYQPAGEFIDEGGFGNPTMTNMMAQMCAGQAKGYIVPRPVVVLDPKFEVEFDDDEYPIRFSVDAGDGEVWDWQRLPGNNAKIPPTKIENAPRWIQGYFTRRGETRTVKSADGWVESYKRGLDHLL